MSFNLFLILTAEFWPLSPEQIHFFIINNFSSGINYSMSRPFLPLAVSLMCGIILGDAINIPGPYPRVILAFLFVSLFVSFRAHKRKPIFIFCLLSIFLLGLLQINTHLRRPLAANHIALQAGKEAITAEGVVSSNPEASDDKTSLIIRISKIITNSKSRESHGLVLLDYRATADFPDKIKYGDYIRFRARLKLVRNFHNPGALDREKQMRYRGILVEGHIKSPSEIILIRGGSGNPLRGVLEALRSKIIDFIRTTVPKEPGAVILAMTVGERKAIPQKIRDIFNATGTSHLLAISGLHVGIIAFLSVFLIMTLLRYWTWIVLRFNIRIISNIAAIFPVVAYALIAGGGISVTRATIMILTFMSALLLGRGRDLFNILALAAFMILIITPPALFEVSFQLSFAAVAAILLITPALMPDQIQGVLSPQRKIYRSLFSMLAVSFSAILGTWPLVAYYFNIFSPVALLANFFVVPVLGFIALPLSLAGTIAIFLSPSLATFLFSGASRTVAASLHLIEILAALPYASLIIPPPAIWQIVLYFGFLILIALRFQTFRGRLAIPPAQIRLMNYAIPLIIFIYLGTALFGYARNVLSEELRITAIDVGRGSSTLLELPGGKRILIDGGGPTTGQFDLGRHVLAPFLLGRGIKTIDLVILTHPHSDHLQGLIYVLDKFDVREIWTNGQVLEESYFLSLREVVVRKRIPHRQVSGETPREIINNVALEVLNPSAPLSVLPSSVDDYEKTNNDSLVIRMSYNEVSVLFPGDIMARGEAAMLGRSREIASRILFVPHHGSRTSSSPALLRMVNPELAVISCGLDPSLSLPHPELLARLKEGGIRVLRTDRDGAITIVIKGKNIQASGYLDSSRPVSDAPQQEYRACVENSLPEFQVDGETPPLFLP